MKVELKDLQDRTVNHDLLRQAIGAAEHMLDAEVDTVSLVLVDDSRISELNRQFLHRSGPTDVMAFEGGEEEELAGEIIISIETAARQAHQEGHNLDRELCILAVHGLLHLLGYDDATPGGRAQMNQLQANIVDTIATPDPG